LIGIKKFMFYVLKVLNILNLLNGRGRVEARGQGAGGRGRRAGVNRQF
jgi:hypothetical protein